MLENGRAEVHEGGTSRARPGVGLSDIGVLIFLALGLLLLHILTNGRYGFHRDELPMLDDARFPAWGYVPYPPLAPFIARVAVALFGQSLLGLRFFSSLAQSVAVVLAGLIARALGGSRQAQVVTALTSAIGPLPLIQGAMFQYTSFDYLWWVLLALLVTQLLRSHDARWWLGIGAVVGLGLMTKYTIAVFIAGMVAGVILTPARRYLTSSWLWAGAGLALLIVLPNLLWQAQHDFISLDFFSSIHARDVRIGRTDGFLIEQFIAAANVVTVPLWLAGLYWFFFKPAGMRYRLLGWMYVVPLAIFLVMKARAYYLAPAYPMLIAAGVVFLEQRRSARPRGSGPSIRWALLAPIAIGGLVSGALALPIAPVNSAVWKFAGEAHDDFKEQIGWPELVETIADIYAAQPAADRPRVGILTANYGEAGAVNLYGPAYGLPRAISGVNTYWLRGYGDSPPQTLIVLGYTRPDVDFLFERCAVAGRVTNRYGVENEESVNHPQIFVCRGPRKPWPEFWRNLRHFG
jgi:4-amino-4-deoxy-L-arabinose transferase-like glycosyltransferase